MSLGKPKVASSLQCLIGEAGERINEACQEVIQRMRKAANAYI